MYKIFVNDCPIILTVNKNISTKLKKVNFSDVDVLDIIQDIFDNNLNGIFLICNNLDDCWSQFQSNFKIQKAAGGKVLNSKNEVLFIYRFDKWDLPKGKIEDGESIRECAIREIEEECGVEELQIVRELETTFHIFEYKQKLILKITYWFLMNTNFQGPLIPQEEEGIEKAIFKNHEETEIALENTYENIKLLF